MNKNIVKYFLTLATIAIASVGCGVNDFNDKLDGFEGGKVPTNIQVVAGTLTPADYSAIASNKDNIALAASISPEATAALKAIGDNKFISSADAQLFLPAFIAATYPQLDNGSSAQVSYVNKTQGSEIIEESLKNQYELEDTDYNGAWGAVHETPFFTKAKPAAQFVPAVLKAKLTTAIAGDYAIANYNFSNTEPTPPAVMALSATAAPATRAATAKNIADINFAGKETATAQGTVIALHSQGVLIEDATGKAFFFNGKETFHSLGDVIQVTGATEVRNGVNQFSKGGSSLFISHPAGAFAYPETATTIDKDNIATYNTACGYVKMTGTLIVDGNFLNLTIDGMDPTKYRGSIQYAFAGMDFPSYNGKIIEIEGYYLGNSGSSTKNFSVVVTTLKEVGKDDITATGIVATIAGTYTSKGIVVATYDKGFMMNDGTGNVIVYQNKTATVSEGDFVTVTGDSEVRYSMGQFKNSATVTAAAGKKDIPVPTPFVFAGADVDAYMTAPIYRYVTFDGKLKKNGNFYEVHGIDDTAKYGSLSYPLASQKDHLDKLSGKTVKVTGYLIGSNTSTGYFSVILCDIEQVITFELEQQYGVYTYNGTAWSEVDNTKALTINEADYISMGLQNAYFDKTNAPSKYITSKLYNSYPYPQVDQNVSVLYHYKEAGNPYMMGSAFTYDGSAWMQEQTTEQYVKTGGKWAFDPSVVLTLTPDYKLAGQWVKDFYQIGSDYVWENIDVKQLGVDEKGTGYTTKFGTNEYYSGSSAYSCNVDLRVASARGQYAAGYEGMTDDQVSALMLKRVCREVFPAMLIATYPNAKPLSGVDVTYTINFGIYLGGPSLKDCTHTILYKVTGPAEFEFVSLKTIEDGEEVKVDE